jgi:hypothetical protein
MLLIFLLFQTNFDIMNNTGQYSGSSVWELSRNGFIFQMSNRWSRMKYSGRSLFGLKVKTQRCLKCIDCFALFLETLIELYIHLIHYKYLTKILRE